MKPDFPTWIPIPSPNFHPGRPNPNVSGLVVHFTAAGSGKGSADYFSKKEVSWKDANGVLQTAKVSASAHLVIDRDGTVYQCVALKDRAWHAGPATKWQGKPLPKGVNANSFTVGIELANWGKLRAHGTSGLFTNYLGKPYKGAAPFKHTDGTFWEPYPEAQIAALVTSTKVITAKYPGITRDAVTGHEHIQTNKNDPGPAFLWERYLDDVFGDDDVDALNAVEDDDRS